MEREHLECHLPLIAGFTYQALFGQSSAASRDGARKRADYRPAETAQGHSALPSVFRMYTQWAGASSDRVVAKGH
jgi:hypothetical protein